MTLCVKIFCIPVIYKNHICVTKWNAFKSVFILVFYYEYHYCEHEAYAIIIYYYLSYFIIVFLLFFIFNILYFIFLFHCFLETHICIRCCNAFKCVSSPVFCLHGRILMHKPHILSVWASFAFYGVIGAGTRHGALSVIISVSFIIFAFFSFFLFHCIFFFCYLIFENM